MMDLDQSGSLFEADIFGPETFPPENLDVAELLSLDYCDGEP
jgi:hypothetical protein